MPAPGARGPPGPCSRRASGRCGATYPPSTVASGRSTSSRERGFRCWQARSTTACTSTSSASRPGCWTCPISTTAPSDGGDTRETRGVADEHSPRRCSSRSSTTDPMHVLLIHQIFAGPDDPGGTRHYEIGRYLVEHGHRVTVIASSVKYLTGEIAGPPAEDIPAGMRIVRLAGRRDLHRSFPARALSYFDFAARAYWAALRVPDVDVVWGTSPPLVQLVPAWLVSRRCRGGLLLEERDLWPEFAVEMGVVRDGVGSRAALRMKQFLYGRARSIVVNSPGFVPFPTGYGVPREKIEVVPNGVDVTQFDPLARGEALRAAWGAENRFVVLYAGALGPANGLDVVLAAAETLRDSRALFVLVGDGKARADLVSAAQA